MATFMVYCYCYIVVRNIHTVEQYVTIMHSNNFNVTKKKQNLICRQFQTRTRSQMSASGKSVFICLFVSLKKKKKVSC